MYLYSWKHHFARGYATMCTCVGVCLPIYMLTQINACDAGGGAVGDIEEVYYLVLTFECNSNESMYVTSLHCTRLE
jgi:hypothetical protein